MTRPNLIRDLSVAIIGVVLSLILLLVWIRLDIETGLIDEWRRTIRIGDALLPTIGAIGVLGSALWIGLSAYLWPDNEAGAEFSAPLLVLVLGIQLVSFVLMLWVGPVLIALFADEGVTYRLKLDSVPWKYTGFLAGGTFMIFALKSLLERSFTLRSLGIAFLATAVMAFLYDVPFDNMLLPPNGDF
ncbi:hypothetical protein [Microbulbifer sp. S227A]|uniref:hypothetical protein n=1 Tax=Microbulbifer sp. S227A TaxID=3415131 RepID=UPI003C7BFB39